MNNTVRSLLMVVTCLGIALSGAWIYVRQKGLAKPIAPLNHDFFNESIYPNSRVTAWRGSSTRHTPNSMAALSAAATLGRNLILWVDVQLTQDGVVVCWHEKALRKPDGTMMYLGLSNSTDVLAHAVASGERITTLAQVLAAFRENRFVINVVDYRPGMDAALVKTIDEANAGSRVLIQSEVDGLLRDVRTLKSLWLFGTSPAQVTQLRMLASIGLAPAAPLKGDVLVTPVTSLGARILDAGVVEEARRRRMKIVAGPTSKLEEAEKIVALGADSVVTQDPEALRVLLQSTASPESL